MALFSICAECEAIREQFVSLLSGTEGPKLRDGLRTYGDAYPYVKDEDFDELLFERFAFVPEHHKSSADREHRDAEFAYPEFRAAVRRMVEHLTRTGHSALKRAHRCAVPPPVFRCPRRPAHPFAVTAWIPRALEIRMEAHAGHQDWSPIPVVTGIIDVLQIERREYAAPEMGGVIALKDFFVAIIERPITQ